MAVALINDPTLVPLMGPLGIDAYINPRATTVSSILRHIRHGRVRSVYSIGDAEAEMIEAEVLSTSPLAGQLIRDVDFPEGVLVGGILFLHSPPSLCYLQEEAWKVIPKTGENLKRNSQTLGAPQRREIQGEIQESRLRF